MKKILLLISATILSLSFLTPVFAASFNGDIKNWNDDPPSPAMSTTISATTAEEVCSNLFDMDKKNIFKEGICAIINVVSISTADFASNVTCTIQNVAMANFNKGAKAEPADGKCSLTGGWSSSGENIYGEKSATSGFYGGQLSELSNTINDTTGAGWINAGFGITRGIIVIIAIAILLVVAFANILHIDVNTYAIKKVLPNLIIGILLGFFSLTIVLLLSRFVDILYQLKIFSPYNALNPMLNIFGGNLTSAGGASATAGTTDFGSISMVFRTGSAIIGYSNNPSFITGILGTIILGITSIVAFVFEYVMALRPLVVGLLTISAPIAFISLVLPQTQIIMKKWWSLLLIVLFYPIIVNFVFFVINSVTQNASVTGATFLVLLLFKTTILAFLIRLPFTIESDFKKLTVSLAKTDFGANLGLDKFVNTKGSAKTSEAMSPTEKNLQSKEAQGIIASATNRFLRSKNTEEIDKTMERTSLKSNSSEQLLNTINTKTNQNLPLITQVAENAFRTNSSRPTELLVKSVEDLSPDTIRKSITHSNIQLWKDDTAIEELRRKNGQVLNADGAAIRADSARQIFRLAQVIDQDRIANPEAVKLLAKKGMLDIMPLNIVKKALQDNLITKADLTANFKQNADNVYERAMALKDAPVVNPSSAKQLLSQDHLDYATGFKDIARQFSDVAKDVKIIPPPPPIITQSIISNMKNADSNTFDNNGMYFLQRLGDIMRQSQSTISKTLQKDGVNPQTANAISQNPQLDIKDVKSYVPGGNISHENVAMLREGFVNRDLSNNLITNVAGMISESKVAVGKSITEKLAQNLKGDDTMNLTAIKSSIQNSLTDISKASPEKLKEIGQEIGKYHPGAMIKTDGDLDPQDIEKLAKHGNDVVETIETIQKKGINEEKLKSGPDEAAKVVEDQISETIQNALTGKAPTIDLSVATPSQTK